MLAWLAQYQGIPRHITEIGAWWRGNRFDWLNKPLPSAEEAELLTGFACGVEGHDPPRWKCTITWSGMNFMHLASPGISQVFAKRKYAMRGARGGGSAFQATAEIENAMHCAFGIRQVELEGQPATAVCTSASAKDDVTQGDWVVVFFSARAN
jgi:hypothetical protein